MHEGVRRVGDSGAAERVCDGDGGTLVLARAAVELGHQVGVGGHERADDEREPTTSEQAAVQEAQPLARRRLLAPLVLEPQALGRVWCLSTLDVLVPAAAP